MVKLFGRGSRMAALGAEAARITRREPRIVQRVDLKELTPELVPYLGQVAYLQLSNFEALSRAIADAPSAASKEAVSQVAALSLAKHHGLVAEIRRRGADPGEAMAPFAARIDAFAAATAGADWHEHLLTSYVTAGMLDDFALSLAAGLPGDHIGRITAILRTDNGHGILITELKNSLAGNQGLASRMAMWGRRLVGDTLLVARSAIGGELRPDGAQLEPVFTELIAAHTRRMDSLGLTA